jgi:hypothetical protein
VDVSVDVDDTVVVCIDLFLKREFAVNSLGSSQETRKKKINKKLNKTVPVLFVIIMWFGLHNNHKRIQADSPDSQGFVRLENKWIGQSPEISAMHTSKKRLKMQYLYISA